MSKLIAILALILGVALALFGVQNQELVALHFLGFTAHALPVSLAILAAAVLGLLVGLLLALPGRFARGRTATRLKRDAAHRNAQVTQAAATTALTPASRVMHALPAEDAPLLTRSRGGGATDNGGLRREDMARRSVNK